MVLEMPPTCASASKTMGAISDRRKSSSAAVNPAGPAPAMTAIFFEFEFMSWSGQSPPNLAAVVQIPILPRSGLVMANPGQADVHGRYHESKLRVRTNLAQILGGEGPGRSIGPVSARGGAKARH